MFDVNISLFGLFSGCCNNKEPNTGLDILKDTIDNTKDPDAII